jgi:Rap1a immunity proteins
MSKLYSAVVGVLLAALISAAAHADGPDISAQRLLESWKGEDPGMRMVAEVIASAFASGFSWGGDAAGKQAYCAPPDLKGPQIMGAFEAFVRDNPALAERPYGATMAATLRKAFPCNAKEPSQP